MTLYDHVYEVFLERTDYLYADVCFYEKLLEQLMTEARCVGAFVGISHAKALARYLHASGCTLVSEQDSIVLLKPLATAMNRRIACQLLDNSVLENFLAPIRATSPQHALTNCWYCEKQPKEPKLCSRCRQALYCNQACQTTHWKEHKETCKPIEVKK